MSRLETIVSKKNTTALPLGSGQYFNGQSEELSSFQEITINVSGSPNVGAPGTLYFEFSPDQIHWDISIPIVVEAPVLTPLTLRVILPYFRVKYINGATPLTEFRLTTLYHRTAAKQITRFLTQTIENNEPIENVRAVLAGFNGDGYSGNVPVGDGYELMVGLFNQGTLSNPLRTDPTGTTIQPVSINTPIAVGIIEGAAGSAKKTLYDVGATIIYIGTATQGTATSASAWLIKKTTLDVFGNPVSILWSSSTAVWNDRASETYN